MPKVVTAIQVISVSASLLRGREVRCEYERVGYLCTWKACFILFKYNSLQTASASSYLLHPAEP